MRQREAQDTRAEYQADDSTILAQAEAILRRRLERLGAITDPSQASDFFRMSLQGTAFGGLEWMQWWTYFMLAWWVSWGAFVGLFLARISRGRTIREFIAGVLLVPSLVFFVWFTVFGGTAIHEDMFNGADIAAQSNRGSSVRLRLSSKK